MTYEPTREELEKKRLENEWFEKERLEKEQLEKELREKFRAFVVFGGEKPTPTISQLLGFNGEPWDKFAKLRSQERSPGWIWFHLPAVHHEWLRLLALQLQDEKIIDTCEGSEDEEEEWGDKKEKKKKEKKKKRKKKGGKGKDKEGQEGEEKKKSSEGGYTETVGEGRSDGIVSFLNKTFAGDKIVQFPKIDIAQGSENATFSVSMPFLDSEDSMAYEDDGNEVARLRSLYGDSDGLEGGQLIPSRTLDESFYVTSNDTTARDRDQVVYRYYQNYKDGSLANNAARRAFSQNQDDIRHRILMVSPLRLWKISRDVVITAFPSNYEEGRAFERTPLGHVYQSILDSQPANTMELVSQIMASLVTIIDGPYYAGLHESLLTIFEAETSAQTTKQLKLYKEFQGPLTDRLQPHSTTSQQRNKGQAGTPTAETKQPSKMAAIIREEMNCFRVVMDIRDELAMISSVITGQERVMQTVTRTIEDLVSGSEATKDQPRESEGKHKEITDQPKEATDQPKEATDQLKGATDRVNLIKIEPNEVELGITLWKSRISNIDQRAQVIEKALSHLLSLKLEVSNLAEAEDTKKLLESSRRILRSNNNVLNSIDSLQKTSKKLKDKADKQSRYLFAFTVVTVIFAPLSFVTSFFAIPSRDFPQDGGVSWSQNQIGGGLAISFLLTVVLVILTIMVNDYRDTSDAENESTPSGTSGDRNILGFARA